MRLVYPRDGHKKVIAMIDAYLDESGIHDGARACVIAGYFGGPGQMKRLEAAWKRTLSEFGFPMKDFHAKDLMKSKRHRPMISALTDTIGAQPKVYPISYAVVVDDFNLFSLQERRFMTGATLDPKTSKLVTSGCPNKPYFVPFQNIIKLVTDYAPVGGKAHFSFGVDRPFADYALTWFRQVNANNSKERPISLWKSRDRLGTPLFPKAAETAPLQAADLLVHLTYLEMEDRRISGLFKEPSNLLLACMANLRDPLDQVFQNKECLQNVIDQANKLVPKWEHWKNV